MQMAKACIESCTPRITWKPLLRASEYWIQMVRHISTINKQQRQTRSSWGLLTQLTMEIFDHGPKVSCQWCSQVFSMCALSYHSKYLRVFKIEVVSVSNFSITISLLMKSLTRPWAFFLFGHTTFLCVYLSSKFSVDQNQHFCISKCVCCNYVSM